jgi:ribosomal-protein-alanine N-acetyltransferase
MQIPIPERLDGDRVALRPLTADDAEAYAGGFLDDPDLGRLLGIEEDPSAEQAATRAASAPEQAAAGRGLQLAVCDPDTGAFVGSVLLHSVAERHRRCEIGFWLIPAARGQGLAPEAVSRFVAFIFDELPIDRIEMTTTPDNAHARRLAARLGFSEEGMFRKRNVERGVRVDLVTFGLLSQDWHGL